jgi:hypothetical protein
MDSRLALLFDAAPGNSSVPVVLAGGAPVEGIVALVGLRGAKVVSDGGT